MCENPISVGVNPATNRIYVSNYYDDIVSVIDGSTNNVIDTIDVGGNPYGVGVNPATNRIYMTNVVDDSVSVIDGSTNNVIDTIDVGGNPYGVGVNPATNRIYMTSVVDDTVSVIDGSTSSVIDTIDVGGNPHGVGVNPVTNRIYVTNVVDDSVSVIDGSTNNVIDTISVGNVPYGVGVDSTTDIIYIANRNSDSVTIIRDEGGGTQPGTVLDTILDNDTDGISDDIDPDDDNDGWSDEEEKVEGTNTFDKNSVPADNDGDGTGNVADIDVDNDDWSDAQESVEGTNPLNNNSVPADDDNDGFTDLDEINAGLDPSDINSIPVSNENGEKTVTAKVDSTVIQYTDVNGSELASVEFLPETLVDNKGPIVSNTSFSRNPIIEKVDTFITIFATIDDSTNGNSNIAASEYYIVNTDPGVGRGTSMNPVNTFDSTVEDAQATVDTSSWTSANSPYTVNVRGKDVAGNWGNTQNISITVNPYIPVNRYVCPIGCQYSSIQEAIDDSDPGDTIKVAQGTYYENISVSNASKNFTLEGGWDSNFTSRSNYQSLSVIDGDTTGDGVGDGSVFDIFASSTDIIDVAIDGLVIKNGSGTDGGGMYAYSENGGSAILNLTNNILSKNSANDGGGIYAFADSGGKVTLALKNNTITENVASGDGGGIYAGTGVVIDIKNTISWGNKATGTGNDVCITDGTVKASYSNIGEVHINSGAYNDNEGNINEEPLFANPDKGDYHLTPCSPCIDTGTNDVELSIDYEGNTRSFDGDGDNVETTDIGADEYTRPDATNTPPVTDAGLDQSGIVGETVTFDGSASYDPDGAIESYDWDFGDGTTASGIIVSHVYNNDGLYEVTLTITDDQKTWCSDTAQVEISGIDCTASSISPTSKLFGPSGGSWSIGVTTKSGCSWNASSNASWINITSGSSGSGNGTISYSVSANTSNSLRTGTITIAGQTLKTFTVIQAEINVLPDIKANGSDGPITLGRSDTLSVNVSFDARSGLGVDCDWWAAVNTPFAPPNDWYYYNLNSGWTPGLSVTYQGDLVNLTTLIEILKMSGLPRGTYTFYFGVDAIVNGKVDNEQLFYDFVRVAVTGGIFESAVDSDK